MTSDPAHRRAAEAFATARVAADAAEVRAVGELAQRLHDLQARGAALASAHATRKAGRYVDSLLDSQLIAHNKACRAIHAEIAQVREMLSAYRLWLADQQAHIEV